MSDVLAGLKQTEQNDLNWWLRYRTESELADGRQAIYIADYHKWLDDFFQRKHR